MGRWSRRPQGANRESRPTGITAPSRLPGNATECTERPHQRLFQCEIRCIGGESAAHLKDSTNLGQQCENVPVPLNKGVAGRPTRQAGVMGPPVPQRTKL